MAGRKLVGNAQRRTASGVLQHGSIRCLPDPAAARKASRCDTGAATSLAELGCDATREALEEALSGAFASVLGVSLSPGPLTRPERQRAGLRGAAPAPRGTGSAAPPGSFSRAAAAGR